MYLNPGNSGFAGIRNDIYVDKSGLISLVNETIDTPRRLTCVSRPRRFGKFNDLVTFRDQDDVLTLLIHLGYLAYDEDDRIVRIPNEEIQLEFARAVRGVKKDETIRRVRESVQLIYDTVHLREEAVAAQIEKIHAEETAALFYNNEQALRSVIKLAYFSYKDYYLKFEELPAGDGYADIVYLPKKASSVPALVIELKWDQSAKGAIDQIRQKKYPEALKGYGGEILLVGIGYDKAAGEKKRKHSCKIERVASPISSPDW